MIKRKKRLISLSLVFALALMLTACGNAGSEAKVEGAEGGTFHLPEPISVIDEGDGEDAASDFKSEANAESAGNSDTVEAKGWDKKTKKKAYQGDGYTVVFDLENTWEGGFQAKIVINNTGKETISDWSLQFEYPDKLDNVWNVDVKKSGKSYTFKSLDWNGKVDAGQSVDFGMSIQSNFKGFPATVTLTGEKTGSDGSDAGSVPTDPAVPGAIDPTATPAESQSSTAPEVTPSSPSEPTPAASKDPGNESSGKGDDVQDAVITKGNQFKKHGRLKVKGRYIVDAKGKAFRLKGVSTHGIAWFPQYVNKKAFRSFKKWGANVVRLACYTSEGGEMYNPSVDWKTIDKGVKAATELGMYVIIDWHILMENNPTMTTAKAKKFFKHFAKKYGKRKNVIFEICNEPNGCGWSDVKSYAKKIIPIIRKYSNNIIVVGTPTWSQDVDTAANDRLTGKYKKNVCYTIHFYAATHKDNIRDKVTYAYKKKLPILCTEFSICDASGNGSLDKSSANTWMKLFKKYKIGYMTWSLCNKAESSALINSSCQKTGGFKKSDLSAAGKWFVKTLKKY